MGRHTILPAATLEHIGSHSSHIARTWRQQNASRYKTKSHHWRWLCNGEHRIAICFLQVQRIETRDKFGYKPICRYGHGNSRLQNRQIESAGRRVLQLLWNRTRCTAQQCWNRIESSNEQQLCCVCRLWQSHG